MSVLKVTGVTDLAGLGGFTLSSGSITANGTLKVNDININGSISGNSKYNIPSFSGQSGQFLSTNGTDLIWSSDISSGGGGGNAAGFSTAGGNFTVNAGVTTVIDTFNINTNTKLSEYTVHLENVNGNIQ